MESTPGLGYSAVMQDFIIGGVAIVWGIVMLYLRKELMGFARPGAQGLRSEGFLRVSPVIAGIAVIAAGVALIVVRALNP